MYADERLLCARYTTSFTKNDMMVGVGAGQQSRVLIARVVSSKLVTLLDL